MKIIYKEDLLDTLLRIHEENPIDTVELDYSDFKEVKMEALRRGICDHRHSTYLRITNGQFPIFDVKEVD